jgi:hypothetical protein
MPWTGAPSYHYYLALAKQSHLLLPRVLDILQCVVPHIGHREDEKLLVCVHILPKLFYQVLFQFQVFLAILAKETFFLFLDLGIMMKPCTRMILS